MVGHSPQGLKESDMTEATQYAYLQINGHQEHECQVGAEFLYGKSLEFSRQECWNGSPFPSPIWEVTSGHHGIHPLRIWGRCSALGDVSHTIAQPPFLQFQKAEAQINVKWTFVAERGSEYRALDSDQLLSMVVVQCFPNVLGEPSSIS